MKRIFRERAGGGKKLKHFDFYAIISEKIFLYLGGNE